MRREKTYMVCKVNDGILFAKIAEDPGDLAVIHEELAKRVLAVQTYRNVLANDGYFLFFGFVSQ